MDYAARKRKTVMLFILMVFSIFMLVTVEVFSMKYAGRVLNIGGSTLPYSNFNGVLTAFVSMSCIIMVGVDYKRGSIISLLVLGFGAIWSLRPILFRHNLGPVPGIINMIMVSAVILVLRRFFSQREKDSTTDYLTGLLNRRGLMRALYERKSDKPYHFLYVDIDDFKFINDNLGHKCGDQTLVELASRISDIGRKAGKDTLVSRIGGDEYVIVVDGNVDAASIAEDILEAIGRKIVVENDGNNVDCYVTASLGVASYPEDSNDPQTIMKYADIAMYESKNKGKNKCFIFDKKLENELKRQAELEGIIKESLDKGYFFLVYQPQYHTENQKLRGFETLLRLKTEDGTFVSPGEFIPAAEKTDLILRIDEYVVQRALTEFREAVVKSGNAITLSINVSAKNICRFGFADMVKNAAEAAGFPFKCLEIEITEYCLAQSLDTAIYNIERLKKLGVQIALDDFGTGYASLSYLSKLSVDLLKIDKSFIDDIDKGRKSNDFISAVISIGHLHDCKVISEGVEYENQLALLTEQGCDFIQGYIWSKPLPFNEAVSLAETCSLWID